MRSLVSKEPYRVKDTSTSYTQHLLDVSSKRLKICLDVSIYCLLSPVYSTLLLVGWLGLGL